MDASIDISNSPAFTGTPAFTAKPIPSTPPSDPYAAYGGSVASDPYAAYGGSAVPQEQLTGDKWSDLPSNILPSASRFFGGAASAITHPIDTLVGLGKLGLGMIANSNPHTAEEFPESAAVAKAFGDAFGDRYGDWQKIKHTMINDPVGFAADASMLLDGAGAALKGIKAAADTAGIANAATDAAGMIGDATRSTASWVNPISGAAKATGAIVGKGAEALAPRVIGSNLTPEQQAAITAASNAGVPLDAADVSSNQFVKGARDILRVQPSSAKPLADFSNAQQDALANWGADLSDRISPTATGGSSSRVATGEILADRYAAAIDSTNDFADTAYDQLRKIAAKNNRQVEVGTSVSPIVDANGNRLMVPVMQTVEGPTSYTATKAALQPIADSIEKTIPANQLQLSPGYSVLKQILARPDVVDLDTALQDASAVKNVARGNDEIPQLRSQSQGLAAKATQVMQTAINNAVDAMGPDAQAALQQGADLTRQKYALRDTLNASVKSEPAKSVDALVQPQDRSIAALTQVSRQVPDMMPDIARSTVQGILDKSAMSPGSAWTAWQNIGPQSKQILFAHNPRLIPQLDNFFTAAKTIGGRVNTSMTAPVAAVLGTGELLLHNPVGGAAVLISTRKLANMLTNPALVSKLSHGLTMPVTSAPAKSLFNLLNRAATRGSVGIATAGARTPVGLLNSGTNQHQPPQLSNGGANEPIPLLPPQ